jgi:arylsulfatase A-like enzyme
MFHKLAFFRPVSGLSGCRWWDSGVLFILVWVVCSGLHPAAGADGGPEQPNLIYILADDLGYGDLSCYGQTRLATPQLDSMAAAGLKFTRHYAGSTVCAPSRCVLLTGKHTGHAAIRGNSPGLMPEDEVTVAELLRTAGYATGCFGKWGVGNPPPLDDPNRHGFDEFYGYVSMFHAHNFFPEFLIHNGQKTPLRNEVGKAWKDGDGRGVAVKRADYVPELVTREALSFIEQHRQRPFFLYLAMNVPHANNEAGKAGMEVPEYAESVEDDWPLPEKGFATMIRNIDRDVGRVLEKIRQLGLERKTLVIFTSDNGPHQEGGHQMPFFDSNGPLKGMKRDLYEGGIRVPMIAWWPNRVPAGTVTDHISGFQDVLPTFAELAGIDPPSTDGISMVPTLLGEPGDQRRHPHLYWEFHEQGGKQAVVRGQWKAVRRNVAKDPNGPLELYDLARDLGEEHDLADQHPDLVAEFAAIMQREHVEPQP